MTVSQANRTVLEILRNAISLPVLEGQSLCLVCVTYSNPPANVSWAWVTQTLIPIQSSEPGVLELPLVQREHEGEFTCAAQNPLGAQRISLSLCALLAPDVQPLLLLGGRGSALQLLLQSLACPLPALAAGGGSQSEDL